MKRLIILALFVFVITSYSATVMPGAVLGMNFANLRATGEGLSMEFESKTGFAGGAIVDISIREFVSVMPGLIFNMKGAEMNFLGSSISTSLNYLSIPVVLVLKYNNEGWLKGFVEIGPELGILMSATDKMDIDGESSSENSKKDYTSTDFGLDFGAGIDFPMAGMTPFVKIVYGLGLSNIAKDAPSGSSLTTRVILLQVGAKFKM